MSSLGNLQQADLQRFVTVTAAGCYYAIESGDQTDARSLLQNILATAMSPLLSDFEDSERDRIVQLSQSEFVSLSSPQQKLPAGNLSELLPTVLPALSERERVVLTESRQGLFLDYTGVTQAEAEELAVLAAGLRSTAEKRTALLTGQLAITSRAFGIVDPAGNSEIGFWPMHISNNVFTLIVLGIPRFNSQQFCTLVWALIERYGPHLLAHAKTE